MPIFAYWYQGARYAVSRSNLLQEFENFDLELFPTNCGNVLYDENWYKMCLGSVLNDLGVAYLTILWSGGAKENLLTLRSLLKQIPQISPQALLKELENKSAYPELLLLYPSEDLYLLSSLRIFENLKWREFILFGSTDLNYSINAIIDYVSTTKLKIINPSNLIFFAQNYTRDQFDEYKEYFEFAKKSRCRIFLILSTVTSYIIEGLYDIGLRKGDFILVSEPRIFDSLKENIENKFMKKRTELLEGSLVIGYKEWEGKLGEILQKEMSELFSEISNMCVTYDSLVVVKNALMHLLAFGYDFEDPTILGRVMREQKFVGCLGDVYFNSDSNSRASYLISYKQILFNQTTEQFTLANFVAINPFSTNIFQYLIEPQWPTGEKTTPTNYIEYSKCGFDDRLIIKSNKGQGMIFIVSSMLLILNIIFGFFSYKYFKNSYIELEKNQEMNLSDYFYLLFFVFEFFEFTSLGPKNGIFSITFNKIQFLLAMDFYNYFDFTFEKFWMLYTMILSVAYIFLLLSLLVFLIRTELFEKFYITNKVKDFSDRALPFIGHIGFLPLISLLMNILTCEEGIGEDLEESFLERDCSQFCYKGRHKEFFIAGIIASAGFLSIGCFLRPYWEINQYTLNLSTRSWYLSVLSVVQFLCVVCKNTLKAYSEAASGFIISAIIALLLIITAIKKPYNYSRVVVYQIISLAMALWALLLSSIYVLTSGIFILIPILFIGLLVIFIFGFFISLKHPKLFISKETISIPGLIRFQFTGKLEYIRANSISIVEEMRSLDRKGEKNKK